ncbi:ABC-2 family transporter protein [Patescibacteria group bacterium]|nr:ABC-2 family transporter protein [Patescibacteria group bacterium]
MIPHKIQKYIKVYWLFCKSVVMRDLSSVSYFAFQVLFLLLLIISEITFFLVLFRQTDNVAGWELEWILLFYTMSKLISVLWWLIFSRNLNRIHEYTSSGTLDAILAKPVDSQFYCSLRWIRTSDIANLLISFILLIIALNNLEIKFSIFRVIATGFLCLASLAIYYAFSLLVTLPCFWFEQFRSLRLISGLARFARYPLDIYNPILRFTFSTFFPIVLALTIPAKFLRGDAAGWLVFYTCFLAVFLLWLSRKLWFVALRRYSSASS